ncbi:MAG: GNAT family N-acetyltransferase [Pseudomonadota bacterium]
MSDQSITVARARHEETQSTGVGDLPFFQTSSFGRIRVDIHTDLTAIESVWRSFHKTGISTFYQCFDWNSEWVRSVGSLEGAVPQIAVGWQNDKPLFLLPMIIRKRGPFRLLCWIGDSHFNFKCGIYDPHFLSTARPDDIRSVFSHLKERLPPIDAIELCCQPLLIDGQANPLAVLNRQESPNHAFAMDLANTFDAVLAAHNGKKKRKKFRWQVRTLEENGGAKLICATTVTETNRILDAAFRQLKVRLNQRGIFNVFEDPGIESFIRASAENSFTTNERSMAFYGLEIDDEIRATFVGGMHGKHFSGCFNSMAMDEFTRVSPGEMLLYLMIEDLVKKGFTSLDLGRGEERYKSSWCNTIVPMFESFIPLRKRAIALSAYEWSKVALKRGVRQNPMLWEQAKKVRKAVKRRHVG